MKLPSAEEYISKVGPTSLGFYKSYADAARAYGDAVVEVAAQIPSAYMVTKASTPETLIMHDVAERIQRQIRKLREEP